MSSSSLNRSPSLLSRLKRNKGVTARSPKSTHSQDKSDEANESNGVHDVSSTQKRNSRFMRLRGWNGRNSRSSIQYTTDPGVSHEAGAGLASTAIPMEPNSSDMDSSELVDHDDQVSQGHPQSLSEDQSDLHAFRGGDDVVLEGTSVTALRHAGDAGGLSLDDDEGKSFDEKEMKRQLGELESSFLPESIPLAEGQSSGADDTYLELGRPGMGENEAQSYIAPEYSDDVELENQQTPSKTRQASTSNHDVETSSVDDTDEAFAKDLASSPAAFAAQRSHQRQVSTANIDHITPVRAKSVSIGSGGKPDLATPSDSRPATPSDRDQSLASSSLQTSSALARDATLPQSEQDSISGWNNVNMSPRSRISQRPNYLKYRQSSQRSSASSVAMRSDFSGGSDSTLNADYALQTGGAISTRGSRQTSNPIARLPSLGSVASYMTRDSDNGPSSNQVRNAGSAPVPNTNLGLDTLSEERKSHSPPETPRPLRQVSNSPTDTAIAQHVQDIQVPDTVARNFRALNSISSMYTSERRPASSGGAGQTFGERSRRTLTLKEQNSKIDKLTKENFDLKLKIHFLDQALQSRSDDGVKELIDKNVEFQTDLANERKESQSLRRKVRDLERKVQEQADALVETHKTEGDVHDQDDQDPTLQGEMHEEILYLRKQLDYSENTATSLREEVLTKELEKRKMADHIRSMAGSRSEDTIGIKETIDMWQDLLSAETGRREQAEEDIRKLREDIVALRIENASPSAARRREAGQAVGRGSVARSTSEDSEYTNGLRGFRSDSSMTLVEQLKHENAELRKDLGAQTSMLTSRNRERERLQQEIEDLKFMHRKGDGARSIAGESIFERSISRAHQRAPSRVSDNTHYTEATDAEREDWERKEDQLRDHNAELKLKYQDLERTHGQHLQYISAVEADFQDMEQELREAAEDLQALQRERDEALQAYDEKESDYNKLENEAVAEIDRLEKELEGQRTQYTEVQKKHGKAKVRLDQTTEDYQGLQSELREITQSVMNLEDEKQANIRSIETLEHQISEAEEAVQKWEQKCKDIDSKNNKLEITQESLHGEITFLREEQEGDKIKIGELEDALNAAQQQIQDEQEKLRDMEQAMTEERQQRDVLENKSKEEVQKVLDDLNNENVSTKDEVRRLRRALSTKGIEAGGWKQKMDEYEQSLRRALGDMGGTKQSLLSGINRLQRDLENTTNELDRIKMDLADKDRLLRHRDGLLESSSLESRRLSDLLEKERNSRKHDMDLWERQSRGQATSTRQLAEYQSRTLDLESTLSADRKKMAALEMRFREQLAERNTLLLALWNRLSTLCGQDWAIKHSSIDGETASQDVIARNLPGFNKNIISAIKTLEGLLSSFKTRIRSIEKSLSKDYQTIEHNLDMRIRRMENLEHAVADTQNRLTAEAQKPQHTRTQSSRNLKGSEEIAKLKSENKILKAELKLHRQHPSALAQQMLNQQSQLHLEHGRRQSSGSGSMKQASPARQIVSHLFRHSSTSAVEQMQNATGTDESAAAVSRPIVLQNLPQQPSDQRWVHRLKELEKRLKEEREARLLDRKGARQRLEEGRLENEELRQMLERQRDRHESPPVQEDKPPASA